MSRNRVLGGPLVVEIAKGPFTTDWTVDMYSVAVPNILVTLDPNAAVGDQVTIIDITSDVNPNIQIAASFGQNILNGGIPSGPFRIISTARTGFILTLITTDPIPTWQAVGVPD